MEFVRKESAKDERINLRVIFPTIIAFFSLSRKNNGPALQSPPIAYFNYLNTALG